MVKVILDKLKVVKVIIEERNRLNFFFLFVINQFRSFLIFRKIPYL